ncbi:VOC family protein [Nocardia goodfellowii]|uniref:VOC domain-containing protein n=1 Tax=Nocardia goodfellowii TaxID=882446 RepID=A0ABS4QKC9_9NOCA|nr:VOC family protein [Nocardia goodfellowii]MBP2192162.1 hypothetical protein [Nocardia goodfellowii]
MASFALLFAVTIDCPDPANLARFYLHFVGGHLHSSNPDYVVLTSGNNVRLDFQRVANRRSPPWPDRAAPRRLHLDFRVENLWEAEQFLVSNGAELASQQPGGERFRVLLDPAGHPFCIATDDAADVPTRDVEAARDDTL